MLDGPAATGGGSRLAAAVVVLSSENMAAALGEMPFLAGRPSLAFGVLRGLFLALARFRRSIFWPSFLLLRVTQASSTLLPSLSITLKTVWVSEGGWVGDDGSVQESTLTSVPESLDHGVVLLEEDGVLFLVAPALGVQLDKVPLCPVQQERVLLERVCVDVAAVAPDDEIAGAEFRVWEDVVYFFNVVGQYGADAGLRERQGCVLGIDRGQQAWSRMKALTKAMTFSGSGVGGSYTLRFERRGVLGSLGSVLCVGEVWGKHSSAPRNSTR